MKLAFGKSRSSREEIEQEVARELEALTATGDDRPPIDWSVYGLPSEIADPTAASADLGAPVNDNAAADSSGLDEPEPVSKPKPRTRAATARAKKPRAPKKTPA